MEDEKWQAFRAELKRQYTQFNHEFKIERNQDYQFLTKSQEANAKAQTKIEECRAFGRIANNSSNITKKDIAVMLLAQYLWVYESLYVPCIDLICYLLVVNGHDLRNDFRNEYASTLKDIQNINCSVKLKFVCIHNFEVLERDDDRQIRNRIAHQDYSIDEAGNITIKKIKMNLKDKGQNLLDFCGLFWKNYGYVLKEINDLPRTA